MLTLVPGVMRRLRDVRARADARRSRGSGELEYRVFVPPIAADAGGGLPTTVVAEYGAARSAPGRHRGDGARVRRCPGGCAARCGSSALDAIHFPLTRDAARRPDAPPAATTILDLQHEEHPEFFSRARAALPAALLRPAGPRGRHRDHDLRARAADAARPLPARSRARPRDPPRRRPRAPSRRTAARASAFLLYPANAWPHKNHARLFEAFAERAARAPRACGSSSRAPATSGSPLPDGVESKGRVPLDELVALYRSAAARRLPEPLRGLRDPLRRGDGLRRARRRARTSRRYPRSAATPPSTSTRRRSSRSPTRSAASSTTRRPAASSRQPRFTWENCARQHDEVYRALTP